MLLCPKVGLGGTLGNFAGRSVRLHAATDFQKAAKFNTSASFYACLAAKEENCTTSGLSGIEAGILALEGNWVGGLVGAHHV